MSVDLYGYENYPSLGLTRNSHTIISYFGDGEYQLELTDASTHLFVPNSFHFHAPSEHTVNDKHYDMELHIVHATKGLPRKLRAVISVFFDRKAGGNADNPLLSALDFSKTTKDVSVAMKNVNVASFLGELDFSKYWHYRGSLTTPPCTEGIEWTVLQEVQPISDA